MCGVKSRPINFRCEPELLEAVKVAAKERGVSFSDAWRAGARLWLDGGYPSSHMTIPVHPLEHLNPGDAPPPKLLESTEPRRMKAAGPVRLIEPEVGMPPFRCPFGPSRCDYRAGSSRAKCPVHGRTVVPG